MIRTGRIWMASASCVLLACGCSSWKAARGTVPSVLEEKPRDRIRVEGEDGQGIVVWNPNVRGDSLYGLMKYSVQRESDRFATHVERDSAIALSDIRDVQVRKGDAVKAVGLGVGVLGLVALGGLIALFIILSSAAD